MAIETFAALEFFAGSGLVGTGLAPDFKVLWANDNSAKKAKVFRANHPEVEFDPRAIQEVHGSELPSADLAWASFPCQDLSPRWKPQWNEERYPLRTVLGMGSDRCGT